MNENDLITLDNGISYAMMKEFNNEETDLIKKGMPKKKA